MCIVLLFHNLINAENLINADCILRGSHGNITVVQTIPPQKCSTETFQLRNNKHDNTSEHNMGNITSKVYSADTSNSNRILFKFSNRILSRFSNTHYPFGSHCKPFIPDNSINLGRLPIKGSIDAAT